MRKLLFVLMTSAALVSISACKTSGKREIAKAETDPYSIPHYDFKLTDIRSSGVTKEQLFEELDPQRIILNTQSICANRALLWGWNMKRKHNINSGKVFVFYSRGFAMDPEYREAAKLAPLEPGEEPEKQWWYHVAPYVIEDGKEYVLDGGFRSSRSLTPAEEQTQAWGGKITRPITTNEWLLRFAKTTECEEITAADTELTEYMRLGANLPGPREGGKARCYIRRIPMQFWMPLSVAMHELGKNSKGVTLNPPFSRDMYWESDLLSACEEALSEDGIAKIFGRGARMQACLSYLGLDRPPPRHAPLVPLQPYDKSLLKRKAKALRATKSRS